MSYRSRLPPLWAVPFLLTKLPRMAWLQRRGDYHGAMRLGREMMGSAKIKTRAFRGYEAMKSQLAELGSDFPYDETFGR